MERDEEAPALKLSCQGTDEVEVGNVCLSCGSTLQQARPVSPSPSGLSLKSDKSMDHPLYFSNSTVLQGDEEVEKFGADFSSVPLHTEIFKMAGDKIMNLVKEELEKFEQISKPEMKSEDEEPISGAREWILKITLYVLRKMNQEKIAETLENRLLGKLVVCQQNLKSRLRSMTESVDVGAVEQGIQTPLSEIYTDLYITEGESGEVNTEHEVRKIEVASKKRVKQDKPIKCSEIFKSSTHQSKDIRTVLTMGVAGIGKTVSVQNFLLDWTRKKANRNIQLVLSLPFREINLMAGKMYTLVEFLHHVCPETKDSGLSDFERYKVLLVLDGLDECRLPLDFRNEKSCCAVTESTSVDVLLVNLIKGNLLPSALLWITSRPEASHQIPPECVDRVTEIWGFSDPQKEKYFRKKIKDQDLASRVILHIKTSRTLHIMCHIPVFSCISATVLQRLLAEEQTRKMPSTLTEMYIHFLICNMAKTHEKHSTYPGEENTQVNPDEKMVWKLGKLAFEQLTKGNLIFYEEDLAECGIDINKASEYAGVCTQILRQEMGLYQQRLFCFVHMSIQEFLAALYVLLTLINNSVNLLAKQETATTKQHTTQDTPVTNICENVVDRALENNSVNLLAKQETATTKQHTTQDTPVTNLCKNAVDQALESKNGHLDLFLRFLLGLSLESNQVLIPELFTPTEDISKGNKEMTKYIKEKIKETPNPERCINLFYCLNELNDQSLVKEVQRYLRSGSLSKANLSSAHWSALVFVLLTSEEQLDVFDLKNYIGCEESLLRLLPVVNTSRTALLNECKLTEKSCELLASALSSNSSLLMELDLNDNDLQDSGVNLLCAGLKSPHCKVEKLRLKGCKLTKKSCEGLASALSSTSLLRELDLSDNDLQDSGVKLLCAGLESPHCKVEKLRLSFCGVTEEGCAVLASALMSNPDHLRDLDLSYNYPGDSGVTLLSAILEDPHSKLEKLNLENNEECWLKSALKKYACELTLDPNTAHRLFSLSEGNRRVERTAEVQQYSDHPERFERWNQVLCREALSGRCYWEVEWSGVGASIAMAYRGIDRKEEGSQGGFGYNDKSWEVSCHDDYFTVRHNKKPVHLDVPSSPSHRVGVYLDWPAGTVSFYSVSSHTLTHIHTFHTTFTEPVYPGFRLWHENTTVTLCQVKL